MIGYGRAWQRAPRPRSARFGFLFEVLIVAFLVGAPFTFIAPVVGQVVAVAFAVGWYASQLASDWRAGRYK